jgi:hypothetical protein
MATGPSANLSTRPSAAKHGPHASTFSCCAMNSPACDDMHQKLKRRARRQKVTSHKSPSHEQMKTLLFFPCGKSVQFFTFCLQPGCYCSKQQIEFMPYDRFLNLLSF